VERRIDWEDSCGPAVIQLGGQGQCDRGEAIAATVPSMVTQLSAVAEMVLAKEEILTADAFRSLLRGAMPVVKKRMEMLLIEPPRALLYEVQAKSMTVTLQTWKG